MTTPERRLADFCLLPELNLLYAHPWRGVLRCERQKVPQACPRCQTPSSSGYDRRKVRIKDAPISVGKPPITLEIVKRRLWCKVCKKPFMEKIEGIQPRRRTTERFRRAVHWACERFVSLSQVCEEFRISSDFAYRAFYEQLELKRRKDNQYPWPEAIGIDEHGIGRNRENQGRAFVTMIVNHRRKKVMEMAFGKNSADLQMRLAHIPGRENVRYVTLDMAESYRNFATNFFPNAQLIADKFHVLRLLSPVLLKERKRIAGTNANRRARRLLLCSSKKLDYFDRLAIRQYLERYPRMRELYEWKERLHGLYRIKGYERARQVMEHLVFEAKLSPEPEIRRLGKTLGSWSREILNYFAYGLTNARVEGFNNKASLVRRRAYGYRNPANYRLRVLGACS